MVTVFANGIESSGRIFSRTSKVQSPLRSDSASLCLVSALG